VPLPDQDLYVPPGQSSQSPFPRLSFHLPGRQGIQALLSGSKPALQRHCSSEVAPVTLVVELAVQAVQASLELFGLKVPRPHGVHPPEVKSVYPAIHTNWSSDVEPVSSVVVFGGPSKHS